MLVASGERLALLVSNGVLKSVGDVNVGAGGNVYSSGNAILVGSDGDALNAYFPLNLVGLFTNLCRGENGVVSTGNLSNVLGHLVDVVVCSLEVCISCGCHGSNVGGGLLSLAGVNANLVKNGRDLIHYLRGNVFAASECGECKGKNEKKNKNSFHDSSFFLN